MEKRKIGTLEVSLVGLGCNNFGGRLDAARTAEVVRAALDAGITFFDTADIYGGTKSEEFLGQALGNERSRVVVATKFGMPVDEQRKGARPEYVRRALEDSLRRLRMDYVDLYQLHEPDPRVPIAETLGALNGLVAEGKVREIGCSNFTAQQIAEADDAVPPGQARFVSVQNEYSLFTRTPEQGVLQECRRRAVAFIPFFPLASGLLTGKYRRGQPAPQGSRLAEGGRYDRFINDARLAVVEDLIAFSEARGHTLLELAISWLAMQNPVASVIAGATSAQQVLANARSASWRLTQEELVRLEKILSPRATS
jgi:aryl-alcohol dehydrogenase-like predicted oxidoreductase